MILDEKESRFFLPETVKLFLGYWRRVNESHVCVCISIVAGWFLSCEGKSHDAI